MEKISRQDGSPAPASTIAIEWENPSDVNATRIEAAVKALARELAANPPPPGESHRVLYLYDRDRVNEGAVRDTIMGAAPELADLASIEYVDTQGLSYYQLKSHAASLARTNILLILDSDVEPQSGWLRGLHRPFEDPKVMVVSGVTFLLPSDLVSRTMALVWIFDLPSEIEQSAQRRSLHANNFATRTKFFLENPFPDSPAFKKQCGIWMEDLLARGIGFVRTPEAQTIHAPHSGIRFVLWRGLRSGLDRDAKAIIRGRGRAFRILHPLQFGAKKIVRSSLRILRKRSEVDLPAYQLPAALAIAWGYYAILSGAQIVSAISRSAGAPSSSGVIVSKES